MMVYWHLNTQDMHSTYAQVSLRCPRERIRWEQPLVSGLPHSHLHPAYVLLQVPDNADFVFAKFMVEAFFEYYPRRVGQVLFVDAPWVFQPAWAVIKPLMRKYAALVSPRNKPKST